MPDTTYGAEDWGRVRWALRTFGGPLGRELAANDDFSGGASGAPQAGEQSEQEDQQTA